MLASCEDRGQTIGRANLIWPSAFEQGSKFSKPIENHSPCCMRVPSFSAREKHNVASELSVLAVE